METTNLIEEKKLPGGLNALTILTFIGSGIAFIFTCWNYVRADTAVSQMEATRDNENAPAFLKKLMTPEAIERARVMAANKLPIFILSLIACALCIAGAVQMRKLKKQGFILWLIGEVLPFIGFLIFVGVGAISDTPSIFGMAIALLFIILYSVQRKHLVN